jgi:hypothetical protein
VPNLQADAVIPAQAGIQERCSILDLGLCRDDLYFRILKTT